MKFGDWVKGWHLVSVAVVAAAAVTVAVLLLDSTEETWHIEADIDSQVSEQLELDPVAVRVECPPTVEWEANEEFHCLVDADGRSLRVTVHMENADGHYTWASE